MSADVFLKVHVTRCKNYFEGKGCLLAFLRSEEVVGHEAVCQVK
jgi:hypothetical protein